MPIKCIFIEIKDADFWHLILSDLHTHSQVRGIYDATDATLMPEIKTLEDAEIFMEMK